MNNFEVEWMKDKLTALAVLITIIVGSVIFVIVA
jgi:hypothetical protein